MSLLSVVSSDPYWWMSYLVTISCVGMLWLKSMAFAIFREITTFGVTPDAEHKHD